MLELLFWKGGRFTQNISYGRNCWSAWLLINSINKYSLSILLQLR